MSGRNGWWKWVAGALVTVCLLLAAGFSEATWSKIKEYDALHRKHAEAIGCLKEYSANVKASLARIEGKVDRLLEAK